MTKTQKHSDLTDWGLHVLVPLANHV